MPARRPCVVAVLPDSAAAVAVARAAAELASERGRRLALVVPVDAPDFTLGPAVLTAGLAQISEDAAAVAGRVGPVLDALGVHAAVHPAPVRTDYPDWLVVRRRAAVVRDLALRLGIEVMVLDASSSLIGQLRLPARLLLPVHTAPATSSPFPAAADSAPAAQNVPAGVGVGSAR